MKVRAVVLDMDGLMLDTEPIYKAAWQRASAELGFELDNESYSTLIGRPNDDCERDLVQRFGSDFPLLTFRARWPELWRVSVNTEGISVKPGLLALLSFLEGHGLPVAIATSSNVEHTELSLRHTGLAGRFLVVVTGDQVERGKPAPDIYLEAARRLQINPNHCIAFEDSDAGLVAANAAGMVPVCVPDLKPPSQAALQTAFRILASLEEAPKLIVALLAKSQFAG